MKQKIYSAKLLWQYRVQKGKQSKKKRVCEERIVIFKGKDSESAYKKLEKYADDEQLSFNSGCGDGVNVHFEFVGILDFIELSDWDDGDEFQEVWFDLYDRLLPLERREKLVPKKEGLREFYSGKLPRRGAVKIKW